jgi:peptide/nickel transport system permease protein
MLVDAALAGDWAAWRSALAHLLLPAGVLGVFSAAYLSRMTRGFMLEQLRQDYVVTARAKGLSEARVVWCHAFANVLAPLATVVALGYAHLLEGSVLTETVFAWPGIGSYITGSLLSLDMNAVLGGTLVVGTALVAINLMVEALSRRLDPRAQ